MRERTGVQKNVHTADHKEHRVLYYAIQIWSTCSAPGTEDWHCYNDRAMVEPLPSMMQRARVLKDKRRLTTINKHGFPCEILCYAKPEVAHEVCALLQKHHRDRLRVARVVEWYEETLVPPPASAMPAPFEEDK